MARFGCLCGNALSNSICPSEDVIYIYPKDMIDEQIQKYPKKTFWDFYDEDYPYYYWYCPKCKRIYREKFSSYHADRIYHRTSDDDPVDFHHANLSFSQIYIFSEVTIDTFTEFNMRMTIQDFIQDAEGKTIYFFDKASTCIYAYSRETKKYLFSYRLEDSNDVEVSSNENQ